MRATDIADLMILEAETPHPHSLTNDVFNELFTR
jgi:hypothetical protein